MDRYKTSGVIAVAVLGLIVLVSWPLPADGEGCRDPSEYGKNLETLSKCYGGGFYYDDPQYGRVRSGRSYVTCLDQDLKAGLREESPVSRQAFDAYCLQFEEQFGQAAANYTEELPRVARSIAGILISREWSPFFAEYLTDGHGYPRGHFSDDLWPEVRAEIETTIDLQTFLDLRLSILTLGTKEEGIEPVYLEAVSGTRDPSLPDYWSWQAIVKGRMRDESGVISRDFEMPVSLDLVFEPVAAADTNPLGIIAIRADWEPEILIELVDFAAETVKK